MRTRITEMLGIEFPLIQGGLGGLAFAELCGAVSAAGALGQLTPGGRRSPDEWAEEIAALKKITDKPFGVNVPVFSGNLQDHLEVAIENGCTTAIFTGGNPASYIEQVNGRVPSIVLASTVHQAVRAEEVGASAVIVVGQEGGGNIGRNDTGTMALIPQAVDALDIPVLGAGGLADSRGVLAALALGAEGVQMGTRFVALQECPADEEWKRTLVEAGDLGTAVVSNNPRMRTRILAEDARALEDYDAQGDEDSDKSRPRGRGAGQGAGLIRDIPTAQELIERFRREVEEGYARLGRMLDA